MKVEIVDYINSQSFENKAICEKLSNLIESCLQDNHSKIWHSHPVWFIDENPIVGFSVLKDGVRLLFWSGQSFNEPKLINEGKFKAAEIRFKNSNEIIPEDIIRYINKSIDIQWDYKNLVKRKGELLPLKNIN